MRVFLIACLLVALQPVLFVTGIVAKWLIDCRGGSCAGAGDATSPIGSPRDVMLTALVLAAPHALAVLIAAMAWLLGAVWPLRQRQRCVLLGHPCEPLTPRHLAGISH
jgi:hypothetical protein